MDIRGLSRRKLLRIGALGGVGAAVLAACGETVEVIKEVPVEVIKEVEVAGATVVKEVEVIKEVAGATVVKEVEVEVEVIKEVEKIVEVEVAAPVVATGATPARSDVPRNRTLIAENISNRNANPEVFNPYSNSMLMHTGSQQLMIEAPTYVNLETGRVEGWQIEDWRYNDDYTKLEMKVREGVEWSDGMPFTSTDIAFTLNMLREATSDVRRADEAAEWYKNVTVDGDHKATIELNKPNPRALPLLFASLYWCTYFVPEHIWKYVDPATFTNYDPDKRWPVFTGPYTLTSTTELETVWDRNDNWWGAKAKPPIGGNDRKTPLSLPEPERVIFVGVATEEKRAAMAIAGEMDTFWHTPRGLYEKINEENPNIRSFFPELPYAYFDPAPRHLAFNLKAAPFDNRDVRWAISFAVDREKIVEFAYEGITTPTDVFFPLTPAMNEFREGAGDLLDKYPAGDFNLDKSAEHMTAAGYAMGDDDLWVDGSGNNVVMQIHVRGGEADQERVAPILADQLRVAGFDATFKITEAGAFFDGIARGDILTNMQLVGGDTVNVSDPWGTWRLLHSRHSAPIGEVASGQRSRFENAEFDAIVDKMSGMLMEDPEYAGLFRDSWEIILREMPIVSLVQTALLTPNNYEYWTNWSDNENNYQAPSQWWGCFLHSVLGIKAAK